MKTRFLIILVIAITVSISPLALVDQAYALCTPEINYDSKLKESELVFTGTVTRLDNYDGPQKVTFLIHELIKGEINTPKYILENSGLIFHENDSITSSSISVDYKIGITYKVYVQNGETNRCTTKITAPPADYMWEPGPEDGNYYSANPIWVDPCDEGYGLSDGVCIALEEMNKDLPTCDPNPKHDFGKCKRVFEEPDNKLQDVLGSCACMESGRDCYMEEYQWWNTTHYIDGIDCEFLGKFEYPPPRLEPEPKSIIDDICGLGTEYVEGICEVIKKEKVKTIGDDAPFFGIFVYLDNLISWIFGK